MPVQSPGRQVARPEVATVCYACGVSNQLIRHINERQLSAGLPFRTFYTCQSCNRTFCDECSNLVAGIRICAKCCSRPGKKVLYGDARF
jgi:hypothetical protein